MMLQADVQPAAIMSYAQVGRHPLVCLVAGARARTLHRGQSNSAKNIPKVAYVFRSLIHNVVKHTKGRIWVPIAHHNVVCR